MTDYESPSSAENAENAGEDASPVSRKKSAITPMRIALWVLVGGAGLIMVITGLVGVLVKAQ
ncbi:hypothetical protein [Salinibacterium sp. M195]|uniref:hypothetical protein n=1 Tax=Salinibacterium sp. M195 TaxID=2583374 RepID=UPI001C633285|nr:hypothetical protein [Salinibacterium sp. M195]QYH35229.1 hypothetical protein FFT87_04285 [Salinibacterium sp. M195]